MSLPFPSTTWRKARSLRILDWDSECRPLHYSEWRDESQITAIAWSWVGEREVHCELLEQDLRNEKQMLDRFMEAYEQADVLTGHYILRHDLPLLTDHCMRFGWSLPAAKLVQDTKTLLPAVKGLGLSQENLGTLFALDAKKHQMNGRRWAVANTLSEDGMVESRQRVVSDVRQHKQLRAALLERGYLKPPRRWEP